jgi:hypothetical protein
MTGVMLPQTGLTTRSAKPIASGRVFANDATINIPSGTEYFHPPCSYFAVVCIKDEVSAGSVNVFRSGGSGDEIGIAVNPFGWLFSLRRNFSGINALATSGGGGAATPAPGYSYFLLWRSFSDTSHQLEVWRSDGGYESNTSTTDTSSISFEDFGTNFQLGNYSAGNHDYCVDIGGWFDFALSDIEVRSLRFDTYKDCHPLEVWTPTAISAAAPAGNPHYYYMNQQ